VAAEDKPFATTVFGEQLEPEQPRMSCVKTRGLPRASVVVEGCVQLSVVVPFQTADCSTYAVMQKVVAGHDTGG
jgi:hypothetical protein